MKKLVFVLVAAAVLAGAVWAFRTLPWWALAIGFVVVAVAAKFAAKGSLKRLFLVPFKMKGAVLHDASVQVHSVVPSQAPTKTNATAEASERGVSRRYFTLDVTIQPKQGTGKFNHWEPGELLLTSLDYHFDPNAEAGKTDDACRVVELQYQEGGVFKADEGNKFQGPMRLKMTLAVRENVPKLKFQYYFEEFGEVSLPVAIASSTFRAAA